MQRDEFYRRRLPHWRAEGAAYFVTWRVHGGQAELTPADRGVVAAALKFFDGKRYELLAWVVMNDHVHVVVVPAQSFPLEKLLHSWKGFTAQQIVKNHGRAAPIWQDEYFDRIIRDEADLIAKITYVVENPWKRWPEVVDYEWVGWRLTPQD